MKYFNFNLFILYPSDTIAPGYFLQGASLNVGIFILYLREILHLFFGDTSSGGIMVARRFNWEKYIINYFLKKLKKGSYCKLLYIF